MRPASRVLSTSVAALCAAAVLAGCGAGAGDGGGASDGGGPGGGYGTGSPSAPGGKYQRPSESPSATTQSGARDVPKILTFGATKVGGGAYDGAALAGKDTVLWFWAPWCTVCARSADEVRAAAAATKDVTFVGVAGLSSDADAMQAFVERHDVGAFTHLADTGGDLYTRFGVRQQHTFVLIADDGTVTNHPAYGKDVDLAALVRATFG